MVEPEVPVQTATSTIEIMRYVSTCAQGLIHDFFFRNPPPHCLCFSRFKAHDSELTVNETFGHNSGSKLRIRLRQRERERELIVNMYYVWFKCKNS